MSDETPPRLVVADEARDMHFPAADGRILAIGSADRTPTRMVGTVPPGGRVRRRKGLAIFRVVHSSGGFTWVEGASSGRLYRWPDDREVEVL